MVVPKLPETLLLAEAKDLANVLKSGKMPAPAHIVQEDVVGPSLGKEAIQSGLISMIIAFILILLYMQVNYGLIPGSDCRLQFVGERILHDGYPGFL